jgi:hypothetical protein
MMTNYPKSMKELVLDTANLLSPIGKELEMLIENNKHNYVVYSAAKLINDMLALLLKDKENSYIFSILILSINAILPYAEECSMKLPYLLALGDIDYLDLELTYIHSVSLQLQRKWQLANEFMNVDKLREEAQRKGLFILKHDVPKKLRYCVMKGNKGYTDTYQNITHYVKTYHRQKV